eukprot:SAG31_NODE_4660_length_3059_cov_2.381081_1_plen_63_part_00
MRSDAVQIPFHGGAESQPVTRLLPSNLSVRQQCLAKSSPIVTAKMGGRLLATRLRRVRNRSR